MRWQWSMAVLVAASGVASGQRWEVHDMNRPQPLRVEVAGAVETPPPADAIVLFDGENLSAWHHAEGKAAEWKVEHGYFEVTPGSGNISTKMPFGDIHLHLEWFVPMSEDKDDGQARGNSGVFLMGQYEVQVLESVGGTTYVDGMAGAIYGQQPPLVNAGAGIGAWNSYDIVFHAPRFEGDELLEPATVTVVHNGVLIQDHVAFEGPARHKARTSYSPHAARLPLALQDHGDPLRFRNVWVRPLDGRTANDTGAWVNPFKAGGRGVGWDLAFAEQRDGLDGMIEVVGDEIRVLHDWESSRAPYGFIYTKESYSKYDLEFAYRWGEKKFEPRLKKKRDSGLLLHVRDVGQVWPSCIEYQIQEGDTGDLIAIDGTGCTVGLFEGGESAVSAAPGGYGRHVRWMLRERAGWNRCRVEVRGDRAWFYVNGYLVQVLSGMRTADGSVLEKGRIGLQIEAAELTFCDVRLRVVE